MRKSRIRLGSSVFATVAKHALIPAMIKFTGGRWLAMFAVFLMTATSLTVPSKVDGAYGAAVFLIACRAAYLFLWCDLGAYWTSQLARCDPRSRGNSMQCTMQRRSDCIGSVLRAPYVYLTACAFAGSGWRGSSRPASRCSRC